MASSELGSPNEVSSEQFAGWLAKVMDNTSLSMAMGVGAELGLFSIMAEFENPETSDFIAQKAGLVERYVREWLAVLVCGKIVTFDRESNKYFLPRHYVPFLVPGKNNMTILSRMLLIMGSTYEQLLDCFKNGGGIPYASFTRFHAWMSEMSGKKHEEDLIPHFVPSVDGLKEKLESGIKSLDIGCGSGVATILLATEFPKSEFHGFDFSEEAIGRAKAEAEKRGLKNCHFKVQDCAIMDTELSASFDYITAFDSIHDQAHPDKVLENIYKMLKKGGCFSLYDIRAHSNVAENVGTPFLPLKYTASLFHCMPVSLFFDGGKGLGTCWGKELAIKMLENTGFTDVKELPMPGNFMNMHIVSKK